MSRFIDVGVDKIHPGIKTHTLWAKEILKIYENK
jgi:phospholipase/lecithinase/hemolysin